MSDQSIGDAEREEIEMLLPWYATGRLDPADLARVEAYLAAHPEVARQLDLVHAEHEQTVAANEALGVPSPGATERLTAALPAATPVRTALRPVRGFLNRLGTLFVAPGSGTVRWAAVAAAALIAVQTVTIATLLSQRTDTYRTAAGGQTGDGIALLVVFADEAKAPAISRLLADLDARIVDGPRAGGVYKVKIEIEERSPSARDALVRRLAERRDVVRAVLPATD